MDKSYKSPRWIGVLRQFDLCRQVAVYQIINLFGIYLKLPMLTYIYTLKFNSGSVRPLEIITNLAYSK